MKILISGAGIAGPTLAYWLVHYGFEPTIVETAPRLRTGGYVIDFWGAGFEIADRMGLLPEIRSKGYMLREVNVVNRDGKKVAGFPAGRLISRMTHRGFVSLPRGELAATIFATIRGKVETIFGDSVDRIEQTGNGLHVGFASGNTREFDLVVGADGLHSPFSELVFGPENQFEKYLGFKAAAFGTKGYRPRDELTYVMYTQVGQQVGRFAMRDDRTMFLFTFADEDPASPIGTFRVRSLVRKRFEANGWECAHILAALDTADDFYFDRVSQIRMKPHRDCGRRAGNIDWRCRFLRLIAGRTRNSVGHGGGVYSRGRTHRSKAIRRGFQSIPGIVRAVRSGEAESRSSIRGLIRTEVETLAVPP